MNKNTPKNSLKLVYKTFLLVLLVSYTSCKSKRSVTRQSHKKVSTISPKNNTNKANAPYALPKDEGHFVSFAIENTEDYINTFAAIAQDEMKVYGIPASITIAQGILESGSGKGELARKTNNHFGIKCHTGWEGDFDYHDDDEKGECFRKYNHPMYSFRDHSLFLTTRGRYSSLFDLHVNDYKGWAKGLRKAGYATDPKYPQKLIYLIEKYNLHKFDGKHKAVPKSPKEYVVKKHRVEAGETLYAISKMYFMGVPELMELNNLKNTNLRIGQELIVKYTKN
ncbi:glucosaminidase domain-containing protein [Cellulophaga omnivescoria]|uniref:glucosaminidase domain-containing protein n=1 Tax=Cellulophaga omnivescoria TaxID=1888890 RepID=UPI0022F0F395|nr:glucosaminidase domain-containing protein [Cellulophaga omnivescoria]WBU90074.1 glucosaminidase domain-containing protein [Cellulophaga omnivescoria]